jgi:L-fuculose-phosphate aldolase
LTECGGVEDHLRQEMVLIGNILHDKGFVGATDGNITVRLGDDHVLVTPSGMSKGFMAADQMLLTDLEGNVLRSAHDGSEFPLHLEAYRQRPDVHAVVHAHPPVAIACSIAGISLETPVLPEVVVMLGGVPTTPYATPGSPEGAEVIRDLVGVHDALLLDHHGVVTVGRTLRDAYLKLEKVEHAAQILLAAIQLGRVTPLLPEHVVKLLEIRRRHGLLREGDEERIMGLAMAATA